MFEDQYVYDNRKIRMLISAICYRHIGVCYRSQCYIQTSLASALAAPSVVGYHLRKQMAHVFAYLFEIEMLQAAIP